MVVRVAEVLVPSVAPCAVTVVTSTSPITAPAGADTRMTKQVAEPLAVLPKSGTLLALEIGRAHV